MKSFSYLIRRRFKDMERTRLQARIDALAGSPVEVGTRRVVQPLDLPAIDRMLPGGGLVRGAMHEIAGCGSVATHTPAVANGADGAASGFAAALLGRFALTGPVAWIAIRGDLHAPGLLALGLDPARLLIIEPANRRMALWAFEECLRTRRLAAALAEIDHLALVESRRLQLAAETHGVAAIVLRAYGAGKTMAKAEASAARTRWRVAAITSRAREGVGAPCWRVTLAHCRGGRSGEWIVEQQARTWRVIDDAVAAPPEARALAG
jgi:protein ImuA